jgi:hypothetical protein
MADNLLANSCDLQDLCRSLMWKTLTALEPADCPDGGDGGEVLDVGRVQSATSPLFFFVTRKVGDTLVMTEE